MPGIDTLRPYNAETFIVFTAYPAEKGLGGYVLPAAQAAGAERSSASHFWPGRQGFATARACTQKSMAEAMHSGRLYMRLQQAQEAQIGQY